MAPINVRVQGLISAPPERVYAILADYQNAHPQILPRQFTQCEVVAGGVGEGTVFNARLRLLGKEMPFTMRVSEPAPYRLVETDVNTGLVTTFSVDPADHGATRLTIASVWDSQPGLAGWIERMGAPGMMRRIFRDEMAQIRRYIQR